jgi:hypothetical protein
LKKNTAVRSPSSIDDESIKFEDFYNDEDEMPAIKLLNKTSRHHTLDDDLNDLDSGETSSSVDSSSHDSFENPNDEDSDFNAKSVNLLDDIKLDKDDFKDFQIKRMMTQNVKATDLLNQFSA